MLTKTGNKSILAIFTLIVVALISISICSSLYAQDVGGFQPRSFIPPSPESSALFNLVDVPVNLSNGMINNSIPLYVINLKEMELPITLNYFSRGITVEEIPSRVGSGWSLNFGGMISRQVRGLPDDGPKGFMWRRHLLTFHKDTTRASFFEDEISGEADLFPDKFHFSFNGKGGSFIFDQYETYENTNIPKVIIQGYSDIKIMPRISSGKIEGWEVTDDDGIRYFFGQNADGSGSFKESEFILNAWKYTTGLSNLYPSTPIAFNGWALTEIITPSGDVVTFEYDTEQIEFYRRASEGQNYGGDDESENGPYAIFNRVQSNQQRIKKISFSNGYVEFKYEDRPDLINGKKLTKVEVFNYINDLVKEITFDYYPQTKNYTEITDVPHQLLTTTHFDTGLEYTRLQLKSLTINDMPPYVFSYSDVKLPHRLSTSQDYWGYFNNKNNGYFLIASSAGSSSVFQRREVVPDFAIAGLLTSIKYPTGAMAEFEYEHNIGIPPHYFEEILVSPINPSTVRYSMVTQAPEMYDPVNLTYRIPVTINSILGGLSVTTSDPEIYYYRLHGTGTNSDWKMTFPAGTNDVFPTGDITPGDYEIRITPKSNNYTPQDPQHPDYEWAFVTLKWFEQEVSQSEVVYGPGKRIKSVTYKENNQPDKIKTYTYEFFGQTSGRLIGVPNYKHFVSYAECDGPDIGIPIVNAIISEGNYPYASSQSNAIAYGFVTEYEGTESDNIGKTEYRFLVVADGGSFYKYPYSLPDDREYLRGKLLLKNVYSKVEQSYNIVSQTTNYYSLPDFVFSELHWDYYNLQPPGGQIVDPDSPAEGIWEQLQYPLFRKLDQCGGMASPVTFNDYEFYSITNITSPLIKTMEWEMRSHGSHIINYTEFIYNLVLNQKPAQIIKYIEEEDAIKYRTIFYYPNKKSTHNYVPALSAQNRIQPYIVEEFIDNGNGIYGDLLRRQTFIFDQQDNNYIYPKEIKKTHGGASEFTEQSFIFNDGLPLEIKSYNQPNLVVLYGYNQSYAIAKIENLDYANLPSLLVSKVEELETFTGNLTSNQIDTLIILNQEIRSMAPDDVLITTYTYKPLVGVTSMTDPRGQSIFYEYDGSGRLVRALDHDGNILQQYQYHYAGPSE